MEKIIELLYKSGYLPIEDMSDTASLKKMFENANLVISAWCDDRLVGIARSICDYSYCCYLSDICVDKDFRKKDIGKGLIRITKEEAGDPCKLILHSSDMAMGFYESIGMERIDKAFIIQRKY